MTAVLLLAAACSGCTGGAATNTGPMGGGGVSGTLCVPGVIGTPMTMGVFGFTNRGKKVVTVTKVSLASPDRLKITTAYLVPVTGRDLIGTTARFPPPPGIILPGIHWNQRVPAAGARIPPLHRVNLVFGLEPTGRGGTAAGVDVFYTDSDTNYHLRTNVSLRVAVPPDRC